MANFGGTLDFATNNNSPTMQTFNNNGSGVRTLNMGSGNTWTITGNNATVFDWNTTTNLTVNPGTAIVQFTYSGSTGTRTIRNNGNVGISMGAVKITAGTDIVTFTSVACESVDFTGFTGSFTGTTTTTVYTGSWTFGTGMTASNTGTMQFLGTSGTQVITSNGVALSHPISLVGIGGTRQLFDNLSTTGTITHTAGTFDGNSKNITAGRWSSQGSTARVVNLGTTGTPTLTLTTSGTVWDNTGATNQTINTTTATVVINDGTASAKTFNTGSSALDFGGLSVTFAGSGSGALALTGSGTNIGTVTVSNSGGAGFSINTNAKGLTNLTFTSAYTGVWSGSGTITNLRGNITLSANMATITFSGATTLTGTGTTQTITSNGKAFANGFVMDSVGGTLSFADAFSIPGGLTLTNGTINANSNSVSLGTFSSTNSNTRVITMGAVGTPQWTLTASGTPWTTSTSTNLTITTNTATISVTDASSSSKAFAAGNADFGGANITFSGSGSGAYTFSGGGTNIGNVLVSNTGAASFTTSSSTKIVTNLTFSGYTGQWTNSGSTSLLGNLTFSTGMTTSGTSQIGLIATSGTKTVTFNGVNVSMNIRITAPGATYEFLDAYNGSSVFNLDDGTWQLDSTLTTTAAMTVTKGTLTTNSNVTATTFSFNNVNTKTINMGNGTWTLTASGTPWNAGFTGTTLNKGNSTIVFNNASASSKTFRGASLTYNNLRLTGGGSGVFIMDIGANTTTFNDLRIDAGLTVQFFAGSTQNVSSFTASGTVGSLITLASTTPGTQFTLNKTSPGIVSSDYLSISDSNALPPNTWFAGANSINGGLNSGWIFNTPASFSAGDGGDADVRRHRIIKKVKERDWITPQIEEEELKEFLSDLYERAIGNKPAVDPKTIEAIAPYVSRNSDVSLPTSDFVNFAAMALDIKAIEALVANYLNSMDEEECLILIMAAA